MKPLAVLGICAAMAAQTAPPGLSEAFERARRAEKQGDFRTAAEDYEQILRQCPATAEIHHNLGLTYYRLRDYGRAARNLRAALQLKPALTGSRLFLGLCEFRLGEFGGAARNLAAVVQADPQNREGRLFLMRTDTLLGRFSLDRAREALQLFPADAEIHYAAGQAALERIRVLAAQANDVGPQSPEYLWLALRKSQEKNDEAAVEKIRSRIGPQSTPPPLAAEYDRLAALVKECFDQALASEPTSPASHAIRGYLYESENRIDEALNEYRQAGDHFLAARLLAQNVRLDEAETEYRAAMAADPQNFRAAADLARVYLRNERLEEARALLRDLLKRFPDDALAWADLGKIQDREGRSRDARQSFQNALRLDPSLNQIHYQLAAVYRKLGEQDLMQRELKAFEAGRRGPP
jgi:tetratricopeptide (TPR) repeat protein